MFRNDRNARIQKKEKNSTNPYNQKSRKKLEINFNIKKENSKAETRKYLINGEFMIKYVTVE